MNLYHVTTNNYVAGQTISINDFVGEACYYNERDDMHRNVNHMIDENRPEGEPERKKCIYACDKLANCYQFAKSENMLNNECHFYEIEMDVIAPHPIIIVDKIFENFNSPNINELINIYWESQRTWFYTEYLGTEMIINREILQEEIDAIGRNVSGLVYKMKLGDDYCKARNCVYRICNRRQRPSTV